MSSLRCSSRINHFLLSSIIQYYDYYIFFSIPSLINSDRNIKNLLLLLCKESSRSSQECLWFQYQGDDVWWIKYPSSLYAHTQMVWIFWVKSYDLIKKIVWYSNSYIWYPQSRMLSEWHEKEYITTRSKQSSLFLFWERSMFHAMLFWTVAVCCSHWC